MQRDHFIPVSRDRIVADLMQDHDGDEQALAAFASFVRLYTGVYVLRLHDRLQSLKRIYEPVNPDAPDGGAGAGDAPALFAELETLLTQANYRELTQAELQQALTQVSPHGLEVGVDLDDFEQLRVYCLGLDSRRETTRDWRSLWLRATTVEIPVFHRLVVCVRFKTDAARLADLGAQGLSPRKARRRLRRQRADLPAQAGEGYAFLRLFKDIPHSDLETLFPNRRIRMRRGDKIKLGITGGGGTASGVAATLTKLAAAASPFAIAGALVGLALIIFRQVAKVVNQRTKYMAVLTRSLYFQCLDNNFGVISHLVDAALEEECKEVLLAYFFLQRAAPGHYEPQSLDREVEQYVRQRFGIEVDFDVADGVRKLAADGLLESDAQGRLRVAPLAEALARLQARWSDYAAGARV